MRLLAASGPGAVFVLNAACFRGVVGALRTWRRTHTESELPAERLFSAMRAGVRYALHAPALQNVLARGVAFFLFASAPWALLPLVARKELAGGPQLYGVLLGSIGIGAVVGALFLPRLRARMSRDGLVMVATVLFALAGLALAQVRNVYFLCAAMFVGGAAWIGALSSFFVAVQISLPVWVRARGIALFWVVFMGGLAGGSALWGQIASLMGIPWALTLAACGGVVAIPVVRRFGISGHEEVDLAPSMHWPEPQVAEELDLERGPVMVIVEYRIGPENAEEFARVMHEISRTRRRDGAFFWELFHDAADPAYLSSASWSNRG